MRRKHDGYRITAVGVGVPHRRQPKAKPYKSTPRLKPPLTAAYTLCTRSAAFYSSIISSSLSHVTMFPFTN